MAANKSFEKFIAIVHVLYNHLDMAANMSFMNPRKESTRKARRKQEATMKEIKVSTGRCKVFYYEIFE